MGRFVIDYWGVQAAVEWSDPKYDRSAADLLLPIWTNRSDLAPKTVFRLSTDSSGEAFVEGPEHPFFVLPRDNVVESLERRLHLHLGSESKQAIFVHAGVVKWAGSAILIPGRSFAGKSTLVHALISAGATFLSDEYAVVSPDGWVHPFPRPMSLREDGSVRRIPARELGWDGLIEPTPASAVVVATYEEGAVWAPLDISPGQAVLELMSNTVAAQAVPKLALDCLSKLVQGAWCCRSSRGDAGETARMILDRLTP